MKNKRKSLFRPATPAEPNFPVHDTDRPLHPDAPHGPLRRVPASEVPAPRRPAQRNPNALRSRAGAIPGRPVHPVRSSREGGPAAPVDHYGPGGANGLQGPGGPNGPQGPGGPNGPQGPGGPSRSGRSGPGGDPRRRRRKRHRGLKIAALVVAAMLLIILGSAYLVWNSLLGNVNIVSPSDMTLPSEYNVPTESLANPLPEEQGVINILLLGADAREAEVDVIKTNTDSMMILTIDQNNKKIKITSLQRDMLVWMPGRSEPAKLNAANAFGGPALAMRVVNDNLRLNISNYVVVNMRGMEALVDIAGGINVNVEKDEVSEVNGMIAYQNAIYPGTKQSKALTKSGMQLLDGRQAVAFARIRKGDSDYARMGRQRVVIQALFNRFMQAGIGTKASMISQGLTYITTNFSKTQMTTFGLSTLPLMSGTIEQLQLPIPGYFVEDPEPVWVNRCDFNGMIPLVQQFMFGRTYPFDPVKRIPGAPVNKTPAATTRSTTRATTSATTTRPTTTATTTRPTTSATTTEATTETTEEGTSASTTSSTSSATSATTSGTTKPTGTTTGTTSGTTGTSANATTTDSTTASLPAAGSTVGPVTTRPPVRERVTSPAIP